MKLLEKRKKLDENTARVYFTQIASALAYLHSDQVRVIHKDIKPANILLTQDLKEVKLADFGVCTKLKEGQEFTDQICGTPNYLPPELLRDKRASFSADIWSAGCLLYCMIVGKPPFTEKTSEQTMQRAAKGIYSMP